MLSAKTPIHISASAAQNSTATARNLSTDLFNQAVDNNSILCTGSIPETADSVPPIKQGKE